MHVTLAAQPTERLSAAAGIYLLGKNAAEYEAFLQLVRIGMESTVHIML